MNARQLMIMSHGYRAIAESAQYFLDHNLDRSSDYLAPAIESVERNRALASLATKYWSRQYKLEQKTHMRVSKVQKLRDQGFDQSYHIRGTKHWKVRCSQCEVAVINGIPCHELGCSNARRSQREQLEDE